MAHLDVLSEKTLHDPLDASLITYCPSMDLVALSTLDKQVLIYRLNGQRVFGATQKSATGNVERIRWKPNGKLLAIASGDGSIRLVATESTKVVHQFSTGNGESGVTCMGWASNLTKRESAASHSSQDPQSWERLLGSDAANTETKQALNLPQDLAQIDIEGSLPKLSVIASSGSSDDVFSSRASLDALFRPFDPQDNDAVDVMVVGTRKGDLHLSIYDSFVIGSFASPVMIGGSPAHLVLHTSHEQYSTHALLMKSSDGKNHLYLTPMDLRFVSNSSNYLSLLASRSTALQNLLRYISEVHVLMISEWKSTQDLPSRFLRNINETLGEKGNRDIVQALYHSVATGHTFPAVREWLVEELAERGLKRWEKAVSGGLNNLKRLVHENLIPALGRCAVILSRLAGIAKFQGSNDNIGFSTQQINLMSDTMACLHLVASKIMMRVTDEIEQFQSFSAWMRYEIDRLASVSSISPNTDSADRESSIDHSKVLLYLQTAMTISPLSFYLHESSEDDYNQTWQQAEQGVQVFDLLAEELRKQEQGVPFITALPRLELICKFLMRQAGTVFAQIAEAEKRNVIFGTPHDIGGVSQNSPISMKMNIVSESICQTHVAFVPQESESQNMIEVARVTLSIENGVSDFKSKEYSLIKLGDGLIKDIKMKGFLLLVLWEFDDETHLLSIPYHASGNSSLARDAFRMEYRPHESSSRSHNSITSFNNQEVLARFSKPTIPSQNFSTGYLEVREGSSMEDTEKISRIVLISDDRLQYVVCQPKDEQEQEAEMVMH